MSTMCPSEHNAPETVQSLNAAVLPFEPFRYMPFLDGLRGISILMVLGFHGMGPFSQRISRIFAGWAGVDIFFVISGFLITSILWQEKRLKGSFSLKNFYVRRCLRIWPAYYVFLAVVALSGYSRLVSVGIAAIYLTDYEIAFRWNFGPNNLTHLYSLAIEEQFYLIWPLVLYWAGRKTLAISICAIGVVWAWRVALIFCGVPWVRLTGAFETRLDCLLCGCVAAILWCEPASQSQIRACLSGKAVPYIVTLALVCAAQTLGHPSTPGILAQSMLWIIRLPTFTILTALLILSLLVHTQSLVARLLGNRLLVHLGRLSYSLYLWHLVAFYYVWPSIAALLPKSLGASRSVEEVGRLLASLLLAFISYYIVETPFLMLKKRWSSTAPQSSTTNQSQAHPVPEFAKVPLGTTAACN